MTKRIHHLWPIESRPLHLPFENQRDAAIALLSGPYKLTRKAGQFLGQIAVVPSPLTASQAEWLANLLANANLPVLVTASAL